VPASRPASSATCSSADTSQDAMSPTASRTASAGDSLGLCAGEPLAGDPVGVPPEATGDAPLAVAEAAPLALGLTPPGPGG